MNIEIFNTTNDVFDSKITIVPEELVFPTSLAIMTIILPSIICFSLLTFDVGLNFSKSLALISFLFNINWNTLIGIIIDVIVSIYWYMHWKTYYTNNTVIRIQINQKENIFLLTKAIKEHTIDSYDYPLNTVKSVLITGSGEGNANGWSIVLALPYKNKINLYTVFVVNDNALKDFYLVGLKLKEGLARMEKLKLLRISDTFLRKVKEKNLAVE